MNLIQRAVRRLVPKSWLSPVQSYSWWPRILESYSGAWQSNVTVDQTTVSSYWAVFSCVTLIAKDVSKLAARVMQHDKENGIFKETPMRPVLKKPNHFQTRIEFFFCWVTSLLLNGNTYVLKRRSPNGFVDAMYILDPGRVTPLIAEDGSIYYELKADNIANISAEGGKIVVPASEIIHDRMYTLTHPLIGVSPIYACGVAAVQGLSIQDNSAKFFQNMSRPSGMLTAPGAIATETAERLKTQWESNYSGSNIGKVAVLGDGLKYEQMSMSASDAQLIEQLKMTAEMIAACYHVPAYKIGAAPTPSVSNTATLNQQYYDQCLQYIIEKIELRLDDGLELTPPFEVWMDLSGLLRMDPDSRFKAHSEAIRGGWKSPNEARMEEDMPPVDGGDTPYMQQQNYALSALAKRDSEGEEQILSATQVTTLQSLVVAASKGEIPADSLRAVISVSFPQLDEAQIDEIVEPIEEMEDEPPEPAPTAPPPPQAADDGSSGDTPPSSDGDEEDPVPEDTLSEEGVRSLIDYFTNAFRVEGQLT